MPEDYHDAAERLFDEAGDLFTDSCCVTAEHLYGLSGECAIKSTLLKLGVDKKDVGQSGEFRGHLPELLGKVKNAPLLDANRYGFLSPFAMDIGTVRQEFTDFLMSRRYFHRNDVDGAAVTKLKASVERLRKVCDKALSQGTTKGRGRP
jgi:hypothetical protein